MLKDKKIIQSFVWYKDKRYFVSTIERDSSADLGPRRYNETIVWEWAENKNRGEMLTQESDSQGSIKMHNEICLKLYNNGVVNEN